MTGVKHLLRSGAALTALSLACSGVAGCSHENRGHEAHGEEGTKRSGGSKGSSGSEGSKVGPVTVQPTSVHPGQKVDLRTRACRSTWGTAASHAFLSPVVMRTAVDGGLSGEAFVRHDAASGSYQVKIRCHGKDRDRGLGQDGHSRGRVPEGSFAEGVVRIDGPQQPAPAGAGGTAARGRQP